VEGQTGSNTTESSGVLIDAAALRAVGHRAPAEYVRADCPAGRGLQRKRDDRPFRCRPTVYAVASSCAGVTERAGGEQDFGHRQQRAAGGFPDHCVERIVELRRSVAGQADLNAATLEMKSVAQ